MIAANLPDIDVVALAFGENLAFRRGITHGPLGLLLLPPLLVAAVVWFDRWQARRGKRPEKRLPLHTGWLLALAYIGALSHPLLDWLNVYGVRCLAPFADRWFYGDTLFIIDVWLWTVLTVGVVWSQVRRRRGAARPTTPALGSLAVLALYVGLMGLGTSVAERRGAALVAEAGYGVPDTVVASPPPVNPFRRDLIYRAEQRIGFGEAALVPQAFVSLGAPPLPANMDDPRVAEAAARSEELRDFLFWSRLPFARFAGDSVVVGDARYSDVPNSGMFTVEVELPSGPRPQE